MIQPTIGFLTACKKTAEIVTEVAKNMKGLETIVKYTEPLDWKQREIIAREMDKNCDAIIAMSATRDQISGSISIPVIEFFYSFADILTALYEASKIKRKAVLIFYKNIDYDLGEWPKILNIPVTTETYYDRKNLLEIVNKAKDMDAVVIGSTAAAGYAEQIGALSYLIVPGQATLEKVLKDALEIVLATHKEKERSARLKALLDFTHEGVIFLEEGLKISLVNSAATEILKKSEQQLTDKKITDINKHKDDQIWNNLTQGPVLRQMFQIENQSVIGNIVPIYVGKENTGTVFTFFEASRLQSYEQDLRRKLASKGIVAKFSLKDIIGKSKPVIHAKQQAEVYSDADSTVVITGETGVGKELFAQSIHNLSKRRNKPFVPLNCSALPKELIESELFGYEEGAFTGAKKGGKVGLFELAHGGTIFLDEITTMPLELQSKMLRVIQEKEVTRLGGTNLIPVDVRIIAATNINMGGAVRKGFFREDLFYRLNVLALNIPPLRERAEDIPMLFGYFIKTFSERYGRNIDLSSLKNINLLLNYYWPGNVRELMNFCERFVILSTQYTQLDDFLRDSLQEHILEFNLTDNDLFPEEGSWKEIWHGLEKNVLKQIITEKGISKSDLAKSLGISRTALWKKLRDSNEK